jgi:hypothetical protein
MANEPKAHSLKATANSLELRPAIKLIDAAIDRMRGDPSHPGLQAQRDELGRIRDQLQSLMDRPLDAESSQPDDYDGDTV